MCVCACVCVVQLNEFISGMFVHCAQQSCICCTIVHASAGVGDVMRERLPEMACDGGWVVSVPDPHVTPARKRVWYLTSEFLVVLSQHVRKTGNPIRLLDLKFHVT